MRVLITRPRAEAERLAADLAARGIESLIEPVLEVRFRDVALPDPARFQAFLCTSANGARGLAAMTARRDAPLYAVGDATARAAEALGFAKVVSAAGDGA
ncbi:MAG: uroporphyrinogen-III synthase, partial [Alphaproteobacteria bacterium]|nr:uroporphyrinogen-III synthase [Alphaproteobacteria bacterium]